MAKTPYPDTTLQPLQTLDFHLANGALVRAILKPQPNSTGTQVAHVDLEYTNTGSTLLNPVGNNDQPRTLIEAGLHAYQFAQHEAHQAGDIGIVEARLHGEEFLEKADVEQITGNNIPVKLV